MSSVRQGELLNGNKSREVGILGVLADIITSLVNLFILFLEVEP